MAGARNTNRRLQRILLRGVVFPAAAAGAIILGASAASAEDGPLSGSLQETTSAVQSTTGGTTNGAPDLTDAQPEAVKVDPVTAPEPEPATVDGAVSEQASNPASAPTPSEPLPLVEAPVEDETAAVTEAPRNPATVVEESAPDTLTQPPQQVETTTQQDTVPDLGETTRQVTDPPTEPIATTQSEATDSVGAVADRAGATLDVAAAPVESAGEVGDTAAQAGSVVHEVSGTATQPVEGVVDPATPALDPTAESTPIFEGLRQEIVEPLTASTSDLTDGALAPIPETTPIFDGLRQEVLEPVVQTAPVIDGVTASALAPVTGTLPTIDGITTPVLAPLTGTLPTIDSITTPVLAPLTGTLPTIDSITNPVLAPLTGTLPTIDGPTSSVLASITGTIDGLTTPITGTLTTVDGPTSSVLAPLTGTLPTIDSITTPVPTASLTAQPALAPVAVPSESMVQDLTAPVVSACVTDRVGSSVTPCAEGAVRGDAAGSFLPAGQSLLTAELMIAANGLLGMVDSLAEGLWFASEDAASSTSTSGVTDPADPFSVPRPLFPEGAPVLGGTSILGSGSQGQYGPIFLLLLAVVGASVLLRNGGLSQLAIGTSTMLSGRAAVVQDRPG